METREVDQLDHLPMVHIAVCADHQAHVGRGALRFRELAFARAAPTSAWARSSWGAGLWVECVTAGTAGRGAAVPAAVATSASAMLTITELMSPPGPPSRCRNACTTPSTVPNSPMNGALLPM